MCADIQLQLGMPNPKIYRTEALCEHCEMTKHKRKKTLVILRVLSSDNVHRAETVNFLLGA